MDGELVVLGFLLACGICGFLSFQPMFDTDHIPRRSDYPPRFSISDIVGLAILFQIELVAFSVFRTVAGTNSTIPTVLAFRIIFTFLPITIAYWWICLCLLYEFRVKDTVRRIAFYSFSVPLGCLCGPLTFVPIYYFGKQLVSSGYDPSLSGFQIVCFFSGIIASVFAIAVVRVSLNWILRKRRFGY